MPLALQRHYEAVSFRLTFCSSISEREKPTQVHIQTTSLFFFGGFFLDGYIIDITIG